MTALSARNGDGGLVNRRLCVPSCTVDADCPQAPESRCVAQQDPSLPKVCAPVSCYTDEECAGGRICIGASCATGGGDVADFPGFCHAG